MAQIMHATTILGVRVNGVFCLGGDGQVSFGNTVVKHGAVKIRSLYNNEVLAGFAGATADAFTLYDLFEINLKKNQGNLLKSSIDLAKYWRRDRVMRSLEAMMIVGNSQHVFILSGQGDIIEPDNNVVSIGSGSDYAKSAALALIENTNLSACDIVKSSLKIAGDICLYTNHNVTIKTIGESI